MNSICGCRSSKTRVSNDLEYTSEDEYHSIDLSHTLIHHQHEEEEEGEQENDSNQVTDKKISHRVIFIGDANIGKYNCFEALNDLKEDEDEECSKKKGIINISIRSGSQLVFSHIEGLEEDPLLRKWKYRKIEVFVLFFSLTSMESLISLAYKWAPEVQNVITHIEKNQIKAIICIVGLYDERSHAEDSNRIHQNVIDSLKGMLSADIYIEVSKNYSVEELSQMVTRIEDQLYFESPSNTFPIKSYSDESSSDEDESSQCPFYGNESCNIPHPSGNVNNDEIFNKKCIIVSRPKQEELKKQIMGLRNRGKATVVSDIALNIDVKEEQNQIIEQIQTILEYKAEEVTNCSVRNLKDNELFNSHLLSSHSEQTLLYKRKFLVEEMPNPPWNVSAWNKKSFKHFIHQKISLEDEIEVRGKLKHGFQHLSAANNCFSPVIPKKYLKQFEVVLLQCIHALSKDSTLNAISVFDFFLLCKFNLVECIKYLIYRYPKGFGYLMMSFSEETGGTPHPICFLEDESIVLKIMQIYHPNLYSTRKDWKGYNILHYCADKNFINAIILFLEFDQQDVIFSLLHMNDSSSPIAVAAQSGNENIARIMYNYLDSNITDDQFLSFFRFNEFKSTSLLRICSQQKLHCLLKDIINSFEKRGISNELLPFLTVQNKVDGERTLLQNIQSESILIKLIPLYLKNDSRNLLLKCKKEKHLGHYLAEKNYSKILLTIHQHCTNNNLNDLFFFDFLLSPNKYGDDCCKLAAWKGSNEFLVTALSLCRGLNKSYLSLLLHGTNQNQENLMELLLFQQRSLIVPRQIIMLMEKEVHSDNKILILSCYRVHISPSEELVSLIEDTEKLLPLSNTKKTLICLKKIIILIFSLLLFCLDIGFDISLAIQYYKDSDEACKHDFTDYSQSLLEEESNFHRATRYVGALCSSTRFYVTLLFIISPWLFYIFEFIRETFINDRPMWIVHVPFKEIKLTSYRSNEQQAKLLNAKAAQLMDKRLKWRSIFGCCSSFNNFCTNLLFIFGFISEFVVTIAFWPIISMFRLFYADVMYDIQHGIKKN
ncbi:uncharacterized protein [Lepeophtheirus salmonis]|uniref:uncharacterized protein n=1 Tax=Lepeophtheirus salmonis TaxID=72036 RepID=UPI001AE76870|nr:uncharacterized protein LOC121130626 [Lepeophtheirus salmonis]XP_040582300.1 uncharacterized protein LOC121130626 [Lepeophtheirus salmonis]